MDLKSIKGIGPKLEQKLNNLGILTIEDLVEYYPYRYNFINLVDIRSVNSDEICTVKASIIDSPRVYYIKRNFNRLTFTAISEKVIFKVVIFNRAFLKPNLTPEKEIVLVGKFDKLKNLFTASEIKFNITENKIEPVYHLSEGLNNNVITKIILESLNLKCYDDCLPKNYIDKYKLLDKFEALKNIHNPQNIEDIKKATLRLKYEELFNFMFKINYLKILNKKVPGIRRIVNEEAKSSFLESLPFTLTIDQMTAIGEIHQDLMSEERMNRLVLGDVGSGKTIVATYAIYLNTLSGYQSAMMAPTEILASQHYQSIKAILNQFGIKVGLLTGKMKVSEKKEILENLTNGEIDLIIGTHALISDNVKFKKLGLVVTDEQHRFGVSQRNILRDKGEVPDVLYLSATPIPRTYALTIYGDLDLSIIKTKPKGRKEIITVLKKEKDIKDVLLKMLDELKLGHQIYVVSPLVETNEELDLKSVFALEEKLNLAFNNKVKIGILHGKLKSNEKEKIMNEFKNGTIKILISTTVIEVGVDVPNSTMIVIYNAERFGLATLHQLRGRVGRNDVQSYCYMISNSDIERLKVLVESNDGFYISERDFELRGQGDLFGVKQSGDITFKIADLKTDYKILLQVKKDTEDYIKQELYKNSPYYQEIISSISFIN